MIKYQKIIKVGNSLAVTLDADFVKQTGLKAGDTMAASYKPDHKVLSLAESADHSFGASLIDTESEATLAGKITPELQQWTEEFLADNKEAMDKLKNL